MSFLLRLNNGQWFAQQCDSLSRNDPKTTTLDDDGFPLGYAQRLGQALRNNTHVASIRLNVWKVLASDIEQAVKKQDTEVGKVETIKEYIKPLLEYLETGPFLRRVEIRLLTANGFGVSSNCNRIVMDLLLTAIHNNANVEELRSILDWIPMHFFRTLLPMTTSLKKLDVQTVGIHACTLEKQLLVSEGIKLNSSLTSIKVLCEPELIEAILTGLADKGDDNQLKELIVALRYRDTMAFWPAMSRFLRTKKRGVDFHLKLDGFFFTSEDMSEFVCGLAGFDPAREGSSDDRVIPAGYSSVVSKLTLRDCGFDDDDAKRVWDDFLQTPVLLPLLPSVSGNESTSSTTWQQPPIRELILEGSECFEWKSADLVSLLSLQVSSDKHTIKPAAETAAIGTAATAAAATLMDNDGKPRAKGEYPSPVTAACVMQATVGSHIQSLSVSRDHSCFEGLFQGLADNAERIRIQKLGIPHLHRLAFTAAMAALAKCIVKVSTLRELEFHERSPGDYYLRNEIMASLKENGHIQSVSANVTSKLVHAYCRRNQCLGQLLLESSTGGSVDNSESSADAHKHAKRTHSEMQGSSSSVDDKSNDASRSCNKKQKMSLCPTLCTAALQLPTMRSSLLSRTLLRLPESIGNTETE